MMKKWQTLPRSPEIEGSVPFDGQLYLLGTFDRIFCGKWTYSAGPQKGRWDLMNTNWHISHGPRFWRNLPTEKENGWLTPEEAVQCATGKRKIPSKMKLIVLKNQKGSKTNKWLEATYSPVKLTWSWLGNDRTQSYVPHSLIEAGFLIDNPFLSQEKNLIQPETNPLWA